MGASMVDEEYNNVMLDIETLSTRVDAAILSIGAVRFDRRNIGSHFYARIDLGSCLQAGLTVDDSTFSWWLKQSEEARQKLYDDSPLQLSEALSRFSSWLVAAGKPPLVWGNGAAFDNAVLKHAYQAIDVPEPWPYWADRCYRTATHSAPKRLQEGVAHDPIDDAISQARHLMQWCAQ